MAGRWCSTDPLVEFPRSAGYDTQPDRPEGIRSMQFRFTEEQTQLRDVVARFCRDQSPSATVRRIMETDAGFDAGVWRQMCVQLGLAALHVGEARGGLGYGAVELGIVMEELGRSLMPAPYLSSVLASTALATVDDEDVRDPLMAGITAGEMLATLILDPRCGSPVSVELSVVGDRLTGAVKATLDGHGADLLLVIALDDGQPVLFAVQSGIAGLESRPLRTMDRTRRFGALRFQDVAAQRLGTLTDAQVERIYDTALVALANESVGGAQALLDSTLAYTKTRVQFGRPIGSFQAIKHRLADLLVDVELAKVAAYQAAAALDEATLGEGGEEVSANASLAKFVTSDVYMTAAREAIQLHGGIGFTWEQDTHLWYRRAKSSEVFLGTPAHHRERMIQELTA
jgi:alkylation response protein AidB-like acyl-CoA dehydrogenase